MTAAGASRRAWPAFALWLLLVGLSTRLLASAWQRHVLYTDESPLLYHAATLGFNYVDFGFVRRGLGGTLLHLFGANWLRGAAIFHVLAAAAVAAGACVLFARLARPWPERAAFALLLIALMLRWAEDPGRTDIAVAALLGGAALAVLAGRPVPAALAVAVSLFVHETGFVFGLPLLAGLWLDQGRWRALRRRDAVGVATVLALALLLYLAFDRLPRADARTMVEVVRSHFPPHTYVDWAIYFAIGGWRGVQTSLCQNAGDPTYALHVGGGLLVIALFIAILRRGSAPGWPAALLVSLPPFLFLSVVANDISRWAVLAAFNVWLLAAASKPEEPRRAASVRALPGQAPGGRPQRGQAFTSPAPEARAPRDREPTGSAWHGHAPRGPMLRQSRGAPLWRVLLAALVIPLIHPKTWPIEDPIFAPTPVLERLARRLGGPATPRFAEVLERCDPGWRRVLDEAPGTVRRR
jgi:hypothetical protein